MLRPVEFDSEHLQKLREPPARRVLPDLLMVLALVGAPVLVLFLFYLYSR